ncbi:MAG: hypothetical protein ACMZ66_00260 [Thalassospira sp.]|uniref:hypothetical protein n=1 Tax=Thalassospira sp. TaxID=1912094 RepID=UPI003A85E3D7
MSEQRKIYEVARFVLDGADQDRLCTRLEIDEAYALAGWRAVASELGEHLGEAVDVETFTVPPLFQDRLHECLVYLLNRIEAEKQREVLGDGTRPQREPLPESENTEEAAGDLSVDTNTDETADADVTGQDAAAGHASTSTARQGSDGPMRVSTVLDDMTLSEDTDHSAVDNPR